MSNSLFTTLGTAFSIVLLLLCSVALKAQVPALINYQAVARNASGQVLSSQSVALRLTVHQSTATGATQYQERHAITTNAQGLCNVQIGGGTVLSGTFAGITWADGQPKYLQMELDPAGGTSYTNMGTQQLVSVPYALVAGSGWNLTGNAGTNAATNFIGTTDSQPLQFRANNIKAGYIANGISNMSLGISALGNVGNSSGNTVMGYQSLYNNNTGSNNTALGAEALLYNVSGNSNVAIGIHALRNNTNRSNLVAVGDSALFNNGIGAVGFEGKNNTAIGSKALYSNTTGSSNTANGYNALYSNTTGSSNTANGGIALYSNTTGYGNTANGATALLFNTTGYDNTANGFIALYSNTTGYNNTANGYATLASNTTGENNTAIGGEALYSNTTGYNNTANGYFALYSNATGYNNTANGYFALYSNTAGNVNTAYGASAYFNAAALDNTTAIGYYAGGLNNVSNRVEIGNTSVSWIGGQVNWGTYSDARIKDNVQENVAGLSFITRLRPVTYHLNIHRQNERIGKPDTMTWQGKYDIEKIQMSGFLAQEVEQAAQAAGYDFSGVEKPADSKGLYSIRYAEMVVPLVKAVQEQQAMIDQLQADKTKQNETINLLQEKADKIAAENQQIKAELAQIKQLLLKPKQ